MFSTTGLTKMRSVLIDLDIEIQFQFLTAHSLVSDVAVLN
jgi:hypothetical protein